MRKTHSKKPSYIGGYIREERLGRGSFASVYKGRHKTTGKVVAIKDILVEKMPEKNLEAEVSIMREIDHPHIVRLDDCIKTPSHVYLIMEYCSMGDMNTYIKETCQGKGMSESDLIHFLGQMASALKYLRKRNFVHRDIKPQNILLVPSTDGSTLPNIKISDFGFAKFLPNASLTSSFCGTPLYMAPEVLSRKSYDAKADLWSVGVLIYEMMMGRKMIQTKQMFELEEFLIKYNNQIDFSGSNHAFSTELKDLIQVLLKKNPADRASSEDFFHHVELLKNAIAVEQEDTEDEDEYVVVTDIKKTSTLLDFNKLTIYTKDDEYPSNSSPPPHLHQRRSLDPNHFSSHKHQQTYNYNSSEDEKTTPPMIRDRKFSVGSASSVFTKALSKASTKIFGSSSGGTVSPPSPTTPITPPIQEENELDNAASKTLVVEEVTLNELLISHSLIKGDLPSLYPKEYNKFFEKMDKIINVVSAVESFANARLNSSDNMPFDFIIAEEAMVLYERVASILKMGLKEIKRFQQQKREGNTASVLNEMNDHIKSRYKENEKHMYNCAERCGRENHDVQGSDISVEKLLYDKAIEKSRAASVKQLINEDRNDCIFKFREAILLLEAILNTSIINSNDTIILQKCIGTITRRLEEVLQRQTHNNNSNNYL